VYPPFKDARFPDPVAPGHAIFVFGVDIWRQDVLTFLAKHLKPAVQSSDKTATTSNQ
jgi:hypothetical protein